MALGLRRTAWAIRHVAFEGLDGFGPALAEAGYGVRVADAPAGLPAAELLAAELLIVLGGPIGANEDGDYPFLRDELDVIERRLARGLPTLGICLGAQLIARALGARVSPAAAKEIGFGPLRLTDEGKRSCLSPFARDPVTLHWHGDSFELPEGATRLASTEACENQAFQLGRHVIGFQFHPEATGRNLEHWLVGHAIELASANLDVRRLRADAERWRPSLVRKADSVARDWLRQLPRPDPG
ncbi:MAG: glutamine amidotransferase [Myxococcota bacterium]|nr:glutamine amidotransferase [Myxococcota bacterium]